jgi:hypothetical protein
LPELEAAGAPDEPDDPDDDPPLLLLAGQPDPPPEGLSDPLEQAERVARASPTAARANVAEREVGDFMPLRRRVHGVVAKKNDVPSRS